MIFAILSALGNASNVLGSKLIFREKEVNFRNYLSITMIFIFLLANILFFIFQPGFPVFTPKIILLFSAMVVLAFGFNSLYFYSLSKADVCDVEQIDMTRPLFTVLLAAAIFPSERNGIAIILTVIAASALIFSRLEKHHLKPSKTTLAMFGYVFLVAIETQIVKVLLEVFNPISFYLLRVGLLSILFYFFLKPNVKELKKKEIGQFFLMSFVIAIEFLSRFFAIQTIGIVKTSLLFLLAPVIVLIFSKIFLKEKLTLKKIIADAIIVSCVAALFILK